MGHQSSLLHSTNHFKGNLKRQAKLRRGRWNSPLESIPPPCSDSPNHLHQTHICPEGFHLLDSSNPTVVQVPCQSRANLELTGYLCHSPRSDDNPTLFEPTGKGHCTSHLHPHSKLPSCWVRLTELVPLTTLTMSPTAMLFESESRALGLHPDYLAKSIFDWKWWRTDCDYGGPIVGRGIAHAFISAFWFSTRIRKL